MIHGVDVSKWQGRIDWHKVAERASFAFIKASQGTASDPLFVRNWHESVGLVLRGAYHFWEPGVSAAAQADAFVGLLREDAGELPPVLDLEQAPVTWGEVAAWMDAVEGALGRVPVLYSSPGFLGPLGAPPKAWPLWVAHYGVSQPTLPPGWKQWTFWQYSSRGSGRDYGVESGYIDLNWFSGGWVALTRLCLGYGVDDAAPPEPPEVQRYRVTAWSLRVRSGPGVAFSVAGRVRRGDVVEVVEVQTTDEYSPWGKIGDGKWISLRYAERV